MAKDKHLADLLAVTRPYEQLESVIGDRIAGLGLRGFLHVVAPGFLKKLDKIGISPGFPIQKEKVNVKG
jgi:hypothetical protein